MDFDLTETQKMIRDQVSDFTRKEVAPIAAEIDITERFPRETVDKMAKKGLLGMPFPKEYGGAGLDELSYAITIEELSKACAATGVINSSHTLLGSWPIFKYGTENQKKEYLIPLTKGQRLGAFGLTEANAGTDTGGQETTAVLDGNSYILNGSKLFITNGGEADTYIIFAMTDKSKGTRGISSFIVDKNYSGFKIGKKLKKMGIRGSVATELIFENCRVPKDNLLGKEGDGFKIAMTALDGGRIGIAAQALGIAVGAFNETVAYMKSRNQFGQPLSHFQGLQWMIADMATEIDAARLLVYRAAYNKDNNLPYSKEASIAKLYSSRCAMRVTTDCVQIFGGYGYSTDYPIERMMRDAKITEIYEGTSQVQQMVISSAILK